jgi:hypothetical protein
MYGGSPMGVEEIVLKEIVGEIKDEIIGEIKKEFTDKEEFRDFRSSVTGELSGFRLAIESINARMGAIESQIMANTARIDALYFEVAEIRGDLKKAISDKEILHDMIFRIERLETKVAI